MEREGWRSAKKETEQSGGVDGEGNGENLLVGVHFGGGGRRSVREQMIYYLYIDL